MICMHVCGEMGAGAESSRKKRKDKKKQERSTNQPYDR